MNKTMSRSILALTVCCLEWVSPAMAQPAAAAADGQLLSPMAPLPDDFMRSTGKWMGNLSLKEIALDTTSTKKAVTPPSIYLKPATPGWIYALDVASYAITGTIPITFDIVPSNNRPPPPNIQYPLKYPRE